ncbi:MAG: hypothetical protein RL106_1705 [Bacteroidota bacterium]|jgi:uncharacterized protein (TIGR02757 family)
MPLPKGSKPLFMQHKEVLDMAVEAYNRIDFIESDPISIPHGFKSNLDKEVSGLMTALISWGNRKAIISTAKKWMDCMDQSPYDFVREASVSEIKQLSKFIYRTLNPEDIQTLISLLRSAYEEYDSLESYFLPGFQKGDAMEAVVSFRELFLRSGYPPRFAKHIANPNEGSAAKRINMFLRWMVRKDDRGVDFGIWQRIPMSKLCIPLDVHSGNTAREFGLLNRRNDDAKAVKELDLNLRLLDPNDPVKYDFALFGLGVNDKKPII